MNKTKLLNIIIKWEDHLQGNYDNCFNLARSLPKAMRLQGRIDQLIKLFERA